MAMKRPSAVRKPAASILKKPKKEEEPTDEPEEEEPEEEELEEEDPKEEEGEDEEKSKRNKQMTKKALEDHQVFIQEASKLNLTDSEFEKALGKLPEKQQQCLWKKFEGSRKATAAEEQYKKETTGTGSLAKKKKLLRSWCLDGGKCSEIYKSSLAMICLEKNHGVEKEWLSKKKMEDELGTEEMKARLTAGTLRWRRNPEDGRFFQFQKLSEKEAVQLKKTKQSQREATGASSTKDLISFEQLMLENLDEDDFALGAQVEDGDSETEGLDKDLAKAMGIKKEERNTNKPVKGDKWAQLSEIGEKTKAGEIEEKIMKFKTEISKDMAALDGGAFALTKQNGDKVLLKNVKLASKKASEALGELAKLMSKKNVKKDMVVPALTKALSTLKECKALKSQLSKALKADT